MKTLRIKKKAQNGKNEIEWNMNLFLKNHEKLVILLLYFNDNLIFEIKQIRPVCVLVKCWVHYYMGNY